MDYSGINPSERLLLHEDVCDRSLGRAGDADMTSDEEVGRQILDVFVKYRVRPGGVLRRNHFMDVRDAVFQRGLNKAVENSWIRIKARDRYSYELTDLGFAAGASPVSLERFSI
jgi:hypothetical protein